MASHVLYLYTHHEFVPSDFRHPFILNRTATVPDEAAKQEALEILKQRFTYLGAGNQATAYESADHKYVIKFFNPHRLINPAWFHSLPKLLRFNSRKWILNSYLRKKKRLEKHFTCYEFSLKDLKEETGIIYNHLDPGTKLSQTIEIIHQDGKLYRFNVDPYPFVLQKKVELVLPYLEKLIREGKIEEAKEATRQIYALFLSRTQKGYRDRSQSLEKNFGFANGKAIQLDTGRIHKYEAVSQNIQQEMERVISHIKPSLSPYPELIEVLENLLHPLPSTADSH